jgi:hypothetical protein
MTQANKNKTGWKPSLVHEMTEYAANFVYLACFFGVFTWYRRLVLAEYRIDYLHYGVSLVESLVLAKIIMLGDVLRLGRKLDGKPLFLSVLYRAVVFTVWAGAFGVLEHLLDGFLHGKGLAGGVEALRGQGRDELLARCLVIFFAFIPFFAFKELGQTLGEHKIFELFFRRKPESEEIPDTEEKK